MAKSNQMIYGRKNILLKLQWGLSCHYNAAVLKLESRDQPGSMKELHRSRRLNEDQCHFPIVAFGNSRVRK